MNVTFHRLVMAMALSGFLLGAPMTYAADDTAALKQQVNDLNTRIAQLEKQLAEKNNPPQGRAARGYSHAMPASYINIWDPFMEMEMMHQQVRNMMGDISDETMMNPTVDIKESPKEYTINMDIPGMNKENIDVKTEGRNLIVSGERSSEGEKDEKGKVIHRERSYTRFMRALPLPADAKTDVVDASYKDGVLTIKVGRVEKNAKPASQKITVK